MNLDDEQPKLDDPLHNNAQAGHNDISAAYQHHTLKDIYAWYDRALFLSHRRFGIPVSCSDELTTIGSEEEVFPFSTGPHENAVVESRDISRKEEEHNVLHCARLLASMKVIQRLVRQRQQGAAAGRRASGSESAAEGSYNERMNAKYRTEDGMHYEPPSSFRMAQVPSQPQSPTQYAAHHEVNGGRTRSTSRQRLKKLARSRLSRVMADIILSCSTIAESTGLEEVEDRARASTNSIMRFAGQSVVEKPMSSTSQEGSSTTNSAAYHINRAAPMHPMTTQTTEPRTSGGRQSAIPDLGAEEAILSFVRSSTPHQSRDHSTWLEDVVPQPTGNASDPITPFLTFEAILNSNEDLTLLEDEFQESADRRSAPGGGSAPISRENSCIAHGKERKYHHHQAHHHAHHHPHQQQHPSTHSGQQPNSSGRGGPLYPHHNHYPPMTHQYYTTDSSPAPTPNDFLLQGPKSPTSSQMHFQQGASSSAGGGGAQRTTSGMSRSRHGGQHPYIEPPKSPSGSMYKAALSFTSMESPRYLPGRGQGFAPRGGHSSPVIYLVDDLRVQNFLFTLRDIAHLLRQDKNVDFAELGLRWCVPGVGISSGSSSSPGCTVFAPPALATAHTSEGENPFPTLLVIEGPSRSSVSPPLLQGLPPRTGSYEACIDASQLSRMSSFSVKRATTAASPVDINHTISLIENGNLRIVSHQEYPIFLSAVQKTFIDVDLCTNGQYRLYERLTSALSDS